MKYKKKIKSYKDLIVWQKAIDLAVKVFEITKKFPKSELYGITSQMRRAAYSVSSNIVEGYCRGSKAEFRHFLKIAYASLAELESQLIISTKLNFTKKINLDNINNLIMEIRKMLNKMIGNLSK